MGGPATDRPFLLWLQACLPTLHADSLYGSAKAIVLTDGLLTTHHVSDAKKSNPVPSIGQWIVNVLAAAAGAVV
jgi:hypothetical protein